MARRHLRAPALAALTAFGLLATPAHAVDTARTVGSTSRLDGAALLRDAADGLATLRVAGRVHHLQLRPTPWRLDAAETTVDGNGVATTIRRGTTTGLVGSVLGDPQSVAVLTVTPSGVDGYVTTQGWTMRLTPRRFLDATAPASAVSVFEKPASAPRTPPGGGQMSAESIGNPVVLEWADSDFYNRFGAANWSSKMAALLNQVNWDYWNAFGWFFNELASVYACTNTTCDSNNGSTSFTPDTLLYNWAVKMKARRDAGTDLFDMAFLYSGKNWTGSVNGDSMLPGRYSAAQFADESWYQGQSSTYEGSQVMAHEIGHTFSAEHDETVWYESETVYVCEVFVPVLNYCAKGHYETHTTSRAHYTIMCGGCDHEPPNYNWDDEFTTWNKNQIGPCHDGSWSSGTFTPSATFSMNMGANCTV